MATTKNNTAIKSFEEFSKPKVKEKEKASKAIVLPTQLDPALLPKVEEETPAKKSLTSPEVFKNEKGNLSGITLPDGRTFLGLSPEEVNQVNEGYQKKTTPPKGTQPVGTAANLEQQQAQGAQLAQSIDAQSALADRIEAQPTQPNYGQALGAGVANVIPGLVGGVVAGAAGGAVIGGVGAIPGAVIGGVAGAIGTFVSGVKSDLKGQLSGELSAKSLTVTKAERNLRALVTDTNQNPANAAQNLELFNAQLALLDREHGALILETNRDLNKWLSQDGTTQLQRYELFNSQGGTRDFLKMQMQSALLNPNPAVNLITMEDLGGEE